MKNTEIARKMEAKIYKHLQGYDKNVSLDILGWLVAMLKVEHDKREKSRREEIKKPPSEEEG